MSLICSVIGARPNFMKMAPVILEVRARRLNQIVVHTEQHFDPEMSDIFFKNLKIPEPDFHLGVRSGTHAEQTARVMEGFERICLDLKPNLVVVAGDVNSTLACALVAAKLLIPVAHIEAGLRSFDRSMPEEINRVLTDHVSSLLFTTERSGNENLIREGIAQQKIHFVGNSMIDSLQTHLPQALANRPWERFSLDGKKYGLATLHRPANVDDKNKFLEIASALEEVAQHIPLVFPAHPRTLQRIEQFGISRGAINFVQPLGYIDFLGLMAKASLVLTDSGGIQEETTVLGVPCVTLRSNTERPITLELGTNILAGTEKSNILRAVQQSLNRDWSDRRSPPLWDGKAAVRIVDVIESSVGEKIS